MSTKQNPSDKKEIVFEREFFKIYAWEQEMFDGSHKKFHKIVRRPLVTIISTANNKVLLGKQLQPHWSDYRYSLFGGVMDYAEEPLEGAKRELLEESGYMSNDIHLDFQYNFSGMYSMETYIFIAKNCQKVAPQKLDNGEKIEIIEMDFTEFMDTAFSQDFRSIELRIYLASKYGWRDGFTQFAKDIF